LNYTEALNYAKNEFEDLAGITTEIDQKILARCIADTTVWIKNYGDSGKCTALVNGVLTNMSCSFALPFAVIKSYNIAAPDEAFYYQHYVQGTYQIDASDGLSIDNTLNITWWLNQQPLVLPLGNLSIDTDYNLLFNPFEPLNHSGTYKLVANNHIQGAVIKIVKLYSTVLNNFTIFPSNLNIPIGETAVFECEAANSFPYSNISWFRTVNGVTQNILASNDSRIYISLVNTLYINNVVLSDAGIYTCVATNVAGTIRANAQLSVYEYPSVANSSTMISIIQHPRNQTIIGGQYTIECTAIKTQSSTDQLVYQFIDESTGKGNLYVYGSELNFPTLQYTVQQNEQNKYFSCNIFMLFTSTISVESTDTAKITIDVEPSISSLSTNRSNDPIPLGTPVAISCKFKGKPMPNVTWYFNGHQHIGNINNNDGSSDLLIENFQLHQVGTYQCIIQNMYRTALKSLTISAVDGIPNKVHFNAIPISTSSILINWTDPAITNTLCSCTLQYKILYSQIISRTSAEIFTTAAILPYYSRNFTLTGLLPNTFYDIKIAVITTTSERNMIVQTVRTLKSADNSITNEGITSTVIETTKTITSVPSENTFDISKGTSSSDEISPTVNPTGPLGEESMIIL
jgi:hypothetical protein